MCRPSVSPPFCPAVTRYNLMFVGYTVAGIPGGFVSLFASILPPTVIMLGVVMLLHRIQREAWVSRFVEGSTPAVAILILTVCLENIQGQYR